MFKKNIFLQITHGAATQLTFLRGQRMRFSKIVLHTKGPNGGQSFQKQ